MKRGVPDGASLFDSALFLWMSHDAKYSGHKKSGVETSHGDRHSVRFKERRCNIVYYYSIGS